MFTQKRKKRKNGEIAFKLKEVLDKGPIDAKTGKDIINVYTNTVIKSALIKVGGITTKLLKTSIWIWHYPTYNVDISNFIEPIEGAEDIRTSFEKKISQLLKARGHILCTPSGNMTLQNKKRVHYLPDGRPLLNNRKMVKLAIKVKELCVDTKKILDSRCIEKTITNEEFDVIIKKAKEHSYRSSYFEDEFNEIINSPREKSLIELNVPDNEFELV